MTRITEKIPPQSREAEMSVLGAILLDERKIADAMELVKPHYFYQEKHRVIFSAMQNLFTRSEPVDLMTLREELLKAGSLELIGRSVYLSTLVSSVATTANFRYYAAIMKDKYILRECAHIGIDLQAAANDQGAMPADVLGAAEQRLLEIVTDKPGAGIQVIDKVIDSAMAALEQRVNNNSLLGLSTGFKAIDDITQGLKKTDLITIAGRPGMGKTSFALNMAFSNAFAGKHVVVFTAEMSQEQLLHRQVCAMAGVDVNADHWELKRKYPLIIQASEKIRGLPIYFDEASSPSTTEIRAKSIRAKMAGKLDIIFIDQLSKIRIAGAWKGQSMVDKISAITKQLKALAKDLSVPVVLLHQLNRECEKRSPKKPIPIMSDLKDSGSVEEDSDLVIFLYRQEYYERKDNPIHDDDKGKADIIIAKHRNGDTGIRQLDFIKAYARFTDVVIHEPPANFQDARECL